MTKDEYKKKSNDSFYKGYGVTTLLAFLSIVLSIFYGRKPNDIIDKFCSHTIHFIVLIFIYLIICFLGWYVIHYINLKKYCEQVEGNEGNLIDENNKIKEELIIEREKNKKKSPSIKRFEDIIKKQINYIAIDYQPFFWKQKNGRRHTLNRGIGFDIAKEIFSPFKGTNLVEYSGLPNYSWNSIFEYFADRKNRIDLILTPMYETRSRLFTYNVVYSEPLFYSDIGIYVRNDHNGQCEKYEFKEAIDYLKSKIKQDKWGLGYLPGEISEIVGKKYLTDDDCSQNTNGSVYSDEHFEKLLEDVNYRVNSKDIVFMEIFKANAIINEKGFNLVNILKENQLIYPVSFVIRKEETALRNFINLRINELRNNGILKNIINKNAEDYDISKDEIDKRFIQKYNYELIDSDYNQSLILFSERMKEEYDILEKVYGHYNKFQDEIIKLLNNKIDKGKCNKILEIGCGTGITSKKIINWCSNDNRIEVVLLDNDKQMIELCKKNVGEPRNVLYEEPIDVLNYLEKQGENAFDVILSAYTIHNFTEVYRKKLYQNIFRVLKKGGIFINADKFSLNDDKERADALKYRIDKFINYLAPIGKYDLLNEWVSHYINDQGSERTMKIDESILNLKKIGFIDVDIVHFNNKIEMMSTLSAKK